MAIHNRDKGDETEEREVWVSPEITSTAQQDMLDRFRKGKPLIASEEHGLKKELESDAGE